MLFLLNDVVFDLDETCPVTPGDARRFEKLSLDYVLELGCERAQGYGIAKPMPAADVLPWARDHAARHAARAVQEAARRSA